MAGFTPLYVAARNGHADVVKLLLTSKNSTPLDMAQENKNAEIVELIIKHGGKTAAELTKK
jgi:ankyrin repeat protein